VDGGLMNNLPTDVVRQMGADIVIGVHLERAAVEANDIQSIFKVLEQSVRVVLAENEVRSLARADAVVSVPLAEFGSTDYQKSGPIMQKGYEAANERSHLLAAFALDDANWRSTSGSARRGSGPRPGAAVHPGSGNQCEWGDGHRAPPQVFSGQAAQSEEARPGFDAAQGIGPL